MWRCKIRPVSLTHQVKPLIRTCHPYTCSSVILNTPKLPDLQHHRHASNASYYFSQDFPPIYFAQQVLETIHSWSHLPWWFTIIGLTVTLRAVITVPLAVHQNKLVAKIELLQPTLKMMSEALKHRVAGECKRAGKSVEQFDQIYKKKHRKMMYELYRNEGCNPIKMFILPWVQLPLWISLSFALRNMTGTRYHQRNSDASDVVVSCPEMASEGVLWFPDLLVPDPLMIIPVAVGVFNLTNIEMHALRRQAPTRTQRVMTNSLRVLSFAMIMFASQVPAAMSLYWATSAGFGICQNVALKLPSVRRHLGLPKTPRESKTPFRDLKMLAIAKADSFLQKQRQDPWKNK